MMHGWLIRLDLPEASHPFTRFLPTYPSSYRSEKAFDPYLVIERDLCSRK